jgi:hypothetical protein
MLAQNIWEWNRLNRNSSIWKYWKWNLFDRKYPDAKIESEPDSTQKSCTKNWKFNRFNKINVLPKNESETDSTENSSVQKIEIYLAQKSTKSKMRV